MKEENLEVVVPKGLKPGMIMKVRHNDEVMPVKIPAGAFAGKKFRILLRSQIDPGEVALSTTDEELDVAIQAASTTEEDVEMKYISVEGIKPKAKKKSAPSNMKNRLDQRQGRNVPEKHDTNDIEMNEESIYNPIDGEDLSSETKLSQGYCARLMIRIRATSFYVIFVDSGEKQLNVDSIDNIVNLFSLVCALVYAIPFSLITGLNHDAMDSLQAVTRTCVNFTEYKGSSHNLHFSSTREADDFFKGQMTALGSFNLVAVYFPLTGIALGMWYYLLRPDVKRDKDGNIPAQNYKTFKVWWSKGRFLVLTIALCMSSAVIADLFVINMYYANFVSSTSSFCETINVKAFYFTIAWITTLIVVVGAFFVFA
jgi:hypothetical protein